MNLAANARDAMLGCGRLTIETQNAVLDQDSVKIDPELKPGQYVMLEVTDTGCGMSEEHLSHVFEPFFTTKEEGKGTGLGLATVYGIVKQSGGYISVSSQPEKGATFKIFFPRFDQAGEVETQQTVIPEFSGNGEVLLLVDDNETIHKALSCLLEMKGFKVLQASNAAEALRISAEHSGPIAILISDVVMPEMNGWELSRQLTLQRPSLKTLCMSGYTHDAIATNGKLEPGTAFLPKPYSIQTLLSKIRELLSS
jgi:CheY-like chemotaxis protein